MSQIEQAQPSVILARQPILDQQGALFAYELLFRSIDPTSHVSDYDATAQVLVNTFTQLGVADVLGHHRGFINVDGEFLLSTFPDLLPADQIVLEILEHVEITPLLIERIVELKKRGFTIALDDYIGNEAGYEALFPLVDILKVEVLGMSQKQLFQISTQFRHKQLLAEKVETQKDVDHCKMMGFKLFQGFFFARPEILSGRKMDNNSISLLKLMNLVLNDGDDRVIEAEFKYQPNLVYSLLKLVNAVGVSGAVKINSIAQALQRLGRRQLLAWLQLLMYANQKIEAQSNPLLQTAAIRGKLMELLVLDCYPDRRELPELALMTGLFSLIDVLLGQPKAEVVKQLHLNEAVEQALLEQSGDLGYILSLVIGLERGTAIELPEGLTDTRLMRLQCQAVHWAEQFV